MKRIFTAVVIMGALMVLPGRANAELQKGMFRLHLESTILGVGLGETKVDGQDQSQDYSGVSVGILPAGAIGLAGTLGSGWVLGGRVTFGLDSGDWFPGSNGDAFVWSLIPYFEYVFLTGLFRPFVTAELGFEGMTSNDDGDYGWWGMVLGGGGGAHLFLRDNISLDFTLMLAYRFGTGHWGAGPGETDLSHWRFSFDTLFGLSAWF